MFTRSHHCRVHRLLQQYPSHSRRVLSNTSFLRNRWRPSPMPKGPSSDRGTEGMEMENSSGLVEDPAYFRRGRTGVMIAIGITAVNGYVWYQWQLAASAAKRGDNRLLTYMSDNFTCSRKNYNDGRWWTVISSGFSHIDIWHILANTLGIVSFYPAVAARLGLASSLFGYIACIGGGSAASLYHAGQWQDKYTGPSKGGYFSAFSVPRLEKPDIPGLGASAGVFGLFTLSMLVAPTATVSIFFIPFPAWLAWGLLTGVDSYCAISPQGRQQMTKITGVQMGHEAHLGGTATALAISALLMPRFWFRR